MMSEFRERFGKSCARMKKNSNKWQFDYGDEGTSLATYPTTCTCEKMVCQKATCLCTGDVCVFENKVYEFDCDGSVVKINAKYATGCLEPGEGDNIRSVAVETEVRCAEIVETHGDISGGGIAAIVCGAFVGCVLLCIMYCLCRKDDDEKYLRKIACAPDKVTEAKKTPAPGAKV